MGPAERVRPEDAAYFYLEGPSTPYHVASLIVLEGPAPDRAELLDAIGERIGFIPRLRQRLQAVPFARPRWVDDDHFDLAYHVRQTSLPAPSGERELLDLVGTLHEQHLDRARPLWECWQIDGLSGGRFAILLKVHHSLVDGVAGAELLGVLLDPSSEPRRYEPEPWLPRPFPSTPRLALSSLVDTAAAIPRLGARFVAGLLRPRAFLRSARETVAGIASMIAEGLDPAPPSPLNVPIGPNRVVAVARAPLDDLRAIKASLGGTVNDVVLAAASGGIRHLLRARGFELRVLTLRALVPVSLHAPGDGNPGNRVTGIIVPLPVSEWDPGRRLSIIRRATRDAKASLEGVGAEALIDVAGALPPALARQIAAGQSVQRFFNVSVTNIPGPSVPMYLRGRRVHEMIPLPPLSGNAALIVAVMSYAGQMHFGIVADADAVPDAELVAEGIEKTIVELYHEAGGAP